MALDQSGDFPTVHYFNEDLVVFKNGGGAFMIPYLVLLMVLAIPIFYLEISVG